MSRKKPHNFSRVWEWYSFGFNTKRLIHEFLIPTILAVLLTVLAIYSNNTFDQIFKGINNLNKELFSILAIQIGFNISALALIVSSNKEILAGIFSTQKSEQTNTDNMTQLISSFAYCIVVQTCIVVYGILHFVALDNILLSNISEWKYYFISSENIGYIFYCFLIALVIHSFMVFIRNIFLIYKFILIKLKK
ncbi:hypothetical protein ACI2JA_15630 [Alkalihalobacillus sp. NPDC078783]